MPYQMNEGGFLSGGFVQDLYDRNQEYERMKQANAAAESYWRQLKMQQEVEMLAEKQKNLADISQALTPTMRKKSVRANGDGTLTIEYEEPSPPKKGFTTQSVPGGFAMIPNDGGEPTFYGSPFEKQQADPSWQLQTLGDGSVVQINPKTGEARPITMNGQPLIGKTASDHEAERDAERQRQTAKQAALADITDAIRNGTPQEQADARASRRLMAQTGRVGMIETTPNEVPWSHPAIQGTGLRGYMGIGYPSQPAETGTFSMQPTVTTNWYDQVLGSAPTNGVPANLNITTPPATPSKTLDAGTARAYLQRAGGDKDKARAMARADGYTF